MLNRRILVVDDNQAIHDDFRKILLVPAHGSDELSAMEGMLFDERPAAPAPPRGDFLIDSAFQGQEALGRVEQSVHQNSPYALAFVDVRMPPGWDGIETIERLWRVDPALQVVICTAFSDHSWQSIAQRLGDSDNLVILKKPFDAIEVTQMAHAMTRKWNLGSQLHAQLRDTRAELAAEREATRVRKEFLSKVSHELRTPLTGIVGMADLLLATPLDTRPRHYAETIRRASTTLNVLIDDLLDFSRIEATQLQLNQQPLDLIELAEDVVELCAARIDARKDVELLCHLAPDLPRTVVSDVHRLRQILFNLLSNAVKFTEAGLIELRLAVLPSSAELHRIGITVSDTGVGIAPEHLERIFEAFYQISPNPAHSAGGVGLGLAICRRLVDLLGGTISVRSQPGRGTVFSLELPLGRAAEAAPRPASSPAAETAPAPARSLLAGRRALIVDPSAPARAALAATLQRLQVDSDGHASAADALAAGAGGWDLLLVDASAGARAIGELRARCPAPVLLMERPGRPPGVEPQGDAPWCVRVFKPVRSDLLEHLLAPLLGAGDTGPGVPVTSVRKFPGCHVLVADDNPLNREVLSELLARMGCTSTTVCDGQAAVQAFRTGRFDAVLLDGNMPVLDGFAAARAIRSLASSRGVPLIGVSADDAATLRDKAAAAALDACVTKPVTAESLGRVLARWLAPRAQPAATPAPRYLATASPRVRQVALRVFPEQLDELRRAIERRDAAERRRLGHKLKGGFLALEVHEMAALCGEIECCDEASASAVLTRLEHAFADLAASLRASS